MAEKLSKSLHSLKYDMVSGDWFEYKPDMGRWYRLNSFEIDQKVFNLLKSDPQVKGLLTSDYRNRVKSALEMLNGTNFEAARDENTKLGYILFKNGVLCLRTMKLLSHNKDYYFTHGLNIEYNPNAKLSIHMKTFLTSISNMDRTVLQVLRAFTKCVLLRDNQYQISLYLYGPGGTGKSTFEKL